MCQPRVCGASACERHKNVRRYLKEIDGQDLPVNDNTYYLFSRAIQQNDRHPEFRDEITNVVRVVFVLHEAYEPNLLAETTTKDAQQMIDHVSALGKVIEGILA
jgi:hypothetical protein